MNSEQKWQGSPDQRCSVGRVLPTTVLRDRVTAEAHILSTCFARHTPSRYGVELEWTVHHRDDPGRSISLSALRRALGAHLPAVLAPEGRSGPSVPLPGGSTVTLEPGGQVEISTTPQSSVSALLEVASGDSGELETLLAEAGLIRGEEAIDLRRPPTRILPLPRYIAMQEAFDRIGPAGSRMMCSTAAIQVCLDIGEPDRIGARWAAVNGLGPVMIALFANSAATDGDGQRWVSERMRSVLNTDHSRTLPGPPATDPIREWVARALDTPLLCIRRPGTSWEVPASGMTFADWIDGGLDTPPTFDDLDYHLSTLFPPVRPRGYLEVRYLDAQRGESWMTPVALLAAFMEDEDAIDTIVEETRPIAHLWFEAARQGLAHPAIADVAMRALDLGHDLLGSLALPRNWSAQIFRDLAHRRSRISGSTTPHRSTR